MESEKKTCFVVMGFGEKTDYSTGRVLNLDATYKHVIKPAVEAAGLSCIRADEIVHAGVIDVPMYKQLLTADVVIADLSTANPNAFYELGVRHALRPFTTIVISESQLKYPFDVNHTAIRQYEHLGKDIGAGEAQRFIEILEDTIGKVLALQEKDSPVYTYLNDLDPPLAARHAEVLAGMIEETRLEKGAETGPPPATASVQVETTVNVLLEQAAALKANSQFASACDILKVVRTLRPGDSYVTQQLALATYKSKKPDAIAALHAAKAILAELGPATTTDPETLGLWGAIHKRLWELTGDRTALDVSVMSYAKGFHLKNDHYNGINLAFMLNVRSAVETPAEAIADWVGANRVRAQVMTLCLAALETQNLNDDSKFWIETTLAEASLGLGNSGEYATWLVRANNTAGHQWMRDSAQEQHDKLAKLLANSPLRFVNVPATS